MPVAQSSQLSTLYPALGVHGFPSIRHNEIRDLTANLLTEVCNDVCIEPDLQPLSGEVLTTLQSCIYLFVYVIVEGT